MIKILLRILAAILLMFAAYWVYPLTDTGAITLEFPTVPSEANALEKYVAEKESKVEGLRADNEARIVWLDSTKTKTPYSLVYLHGFSASWYEGQPIHREFAEKYGMNLYLARLEGHGIGSKESFKNLTSDGYMDSAIEAIEIGKQLGEKVIVMGTSTGATVGLPAMAFDPEIAGGIFYSPNIEIFDQNSKLLRKPFGLSLAQWIGGSEYHRFDGPSSIYKYWTNEYRMEGLVTVQELIEKTMTAETFQNVKQPSLFLAYYENEENQDPVVSVAAIDVMFEQLGTEDSKKVFKKLVTPRDHVMACESHSKDLEIVRKETAAFLEGVMGLQPLNDLN